MAVADVFKTIKENEVKFVDLRFTDTKGKEQHVSVPVKAFGEDKFKDGHAFDGSSIAGWKGIEASDMLLMPDPDSAHMDPFYDEPTIVLTCDVLEPLTGKGYERDPRTIAKRAEAYLKSSGLGDVAYFGPEPEFFIFDSVEWKIDMSGSFVKINSEEAPWSSDLKLEGGNLGHRPPVKGGYFPVPPMDSQQDIRSAICLALEEQGVEVEVHHHEVAAPGQNEIGTKFNSLVKRADWMQILKYTVLNVARSYGKTATFMPKPVVGDNGSGMHVHQSVWKGGVNLFAGDGYAGLSDFALYYIGGDHQAREGAQRHHQSGNEFIQAPRPRIRSADQPRVLGAQPLGVVPYSVRGEPEVASRGGALPGSDGECVSRVLRAAARGPGRRAEQDPPRRSARQEPVRPRARGGRESAAPMRVAGRGAGQPRQGPRVPHAWGCLHGRHDRCVHRAQDGRGHEVPHDHAPHRVRDVLLGLACGRPGPAGRGWPVRPLFS